MNEVYRVIEILNDKELLVNYGSDNGASVGDTVRIFSVGEVVIDPDTKASLGTLDIIKGELEISTVYEKFSICKKFKKGNISPILNPLAYRSTLESVELNIDKSEISGRKFPKESSTIIKVGDSVTVLK